MAFAQALSEKDLQEIQSSFKKDASTKAIQNILTADKDIKGNALNRDLQGKIDHYFKYRADVKGIPISSVPDGAGCLPQ